MSVTASPSLATEPFIVLDPHQVEGVEFLLARKAAILGDDVGVGKTFTSLEAAFRAVEAVQEPFIFIVVPPHLILQWREAIKAYMIGRRIMPVHVVSRYSRPTQELGWGIHLTPYTNIQNQGRTKYPHPWRQIWDVVIADEAHRMRKAKTQSHKNFDLLAARRTYVLTGTPSENNPADIWSLLHFVDRKNFRSYWDFVDEWMLTWKDPWKVHIIGVRPGQLEAFHEMVARHMIRRTREFAKVRPVDVPVEVTTGTAAAHRAAVKTWKLSYPEDPLHGTPAYDEYIKSAGALLAKLRIMVSKDPAKLDAAASVLEDVDPTAPVIYFTWYRESAEGLADYLRAQAPQENRGKGEQGARVTVIHGGMSPDERHYVTERWKREAEGGEGPILVGTMKSIGEGLNLQAASTAVFYEEDYLPGTMHQALGRINRRGQEADTISRYWIHAIATVETSVHYVQDRRHGSINAAVIDHLLEELHDD